MISDAGLNSLAIFLGSLSMLLIVLYHFLEVNAKDDGSAPGTTAIEKAGAKAEVAGKGVVGGNGAGAGKNAVKGGKT